MDKKIKIVVVDEVSMLPINMWNLLLSYNFYVLACGDPGQLPPPPGENGENVSNNVLEHPHVFLDEIMRQAQESEIIRLSMHVREGKSLNTFDFQKEEVMIFNKREINIDMLKWADQILCGTNKTKARLNAQLREAYGFSKDAQIGDKIINVHNEWEIVSNKQNPLTNGIIGKIKDIQIGTRTYPPQVFQQTVSAPMAAITLCDSDNEDEIFPTLYFDYTEILTGQPFFTGPQQYRILKRFPQGYLLHANFGYCITTWKAQGSEWPKVLMFEDYWPIEKELKIKYLYTGITRAESRIVLVKEK